MTAILRDASHVRAGWLANEALHLPQNPMNSRTIWIIVISAVIAGCSRDSSITHGADGSPEWDRHLAAVITPGLTVDSARATMQRNGFLCQRSADELWCDKQSGGRFAIVRRRWQATLALQNGHVRTVKGTTGRIGP